MSKDMECWGKALGTARGKNMRVFTDSFARVPTKETVALKPVLSVRMD